MQEDLEKKGREIARQLGNGVSYRGLWFAEKEFLGYTFNDDSSITESTFTAKGLEEARQRLVDCRISFGKPLPDFVQPPFPKTP